MSHMTRSFELGTALLVLVALGSTPVWAQGRGDKGKGHEDGKSKVTVEVAVTAAKDVLVKQGFEVVRVEAKPDHHIIYYRAGNQGRGKGHGPPVRMIVRRVDDRVVLEEAPDGLRLEIGVKLGIKL